MIGRSIDPANDVHQNLHHSLIFIAIKLSQQNRKQPQEAALAETDTDT